MPFSSIPEILDELRAGRMIVLTDDEDRENEGDLVIAAEKVTPEAVNFMLREARGVLCLSLSPEQCDRLNLPQQVSENAAPLGTAFTVSIDAHQRFGVTTGVSAADRARTIQVAVGDEVRPSDLVRPGHVNPLRARPGGVLVRAGQTEGSVDLARLAGLKPAAVIIEVMNPDGSMARVAQLAEFVARHRLKMGTVADIIEYRLQRERLIERVEQIDLPTRFGPFDLIAYAHNPAFPDRLPFDTVPGAPRGENASGEGRGALSSALVDAEPHLALCCGGVGRLDEAGRPIEHPEPVLVRMHSECLTGDVFGSLRCDCGEQLAASLELVQRAGKGAVVYLRQEGRGIGLANKLHAYRLQQDGLDTVEANRRLGFRADRRDYGVGAQILRDLGLHQIRILTNNPKKVARLQVYGLKIVEQVPIEMPAHEANRRYLTTKKEKLGHIFKGL